VIPAGHAPLAHQWFGDSVSVRFWRDLRLNEGFATYAEWMWSEHDGALTVQQWFNLRGPTRPPNPDPPPAGLSRTTSVPAACAVVPHAPTHRTRC
jgi:hypothetical protein